MMKKDLSFKHGEKHIKKHPKAHTKGKVKKSGEAKRDSSFNIEDILSLGGEKEDYEKLLEVNADAELETGHVEDTTDNLRDEIRNFLQTGGFDNISSQDSMSAHKDVGDAKRSSTKNVGKNVIKTVDPSNDKNDNPTIKRKRKESSSGSTSKKEAVSGTSSKKKVKSCQNTTDEAVAGPPSKKKINSASVASEEEMKRHSSKNNIKSSSLVTLDSSHSDKRKNRPSSMVTKETANSVPNKKKVRNDAEVVDTSNETHNLTVENKCMKTKKENSSLFRSLEYKKYDHLLLKNSHPWYNLTKDVPKSEPALYENEINDLFTVAKQYWQTETEIYQNMKDNDRSSDAKWLRTVLTSGTLSDRVAALTMLSQESPIHCTRNLEALMNMSRKKARREALVAIDSLRHLWIANLLPDYKLRKFNEFPLEQLNAYNKSKSKEENIKLLVTMVFEDSLKKTYSDFIEILQGFSKDPLADIRNKILGIAHELLQMKPEQEQLLLLILVNKLGDPERKVASKASFLLCELVSKHPNMKMIVIKEVERMMYRPNMAEKAQYYAICFLNQIVLSHEEKEVASKLISIYFPFFELVVAKGDKHGGKKVAKGSSSEHRNKLLGGLLTGVNRAYPYVEDMNEVHEDQLNTLFRLAHIKHFNTSVQAFMLIYQVMQSRQSLSDRYYQALYGKLLDSDISTSCKHTVFLNLLFKSLKNDPVLKRVKAFVKRLLQICSQEQPSLLCGILYLISEVIKTNPGINSLIMQHEDQDEDEHFVDAPLDDEVNNNKIDSSDVECENKDSSSSPDFKKSWTFLKQENKSDCYDINHRNPLYTGAEKSCLWEIVPLLSQFHPSVVHFTSSIVNRKGIKYKGDPSQDFTLISFLDRFMYRNPKQKDIEHGSSLMQRKETSLRRKEEPVNSKAFLQKSEDDVPVDQVFFHRYFKQQMVDKELKTGDKGELYKTEIDDVDDIDFAGEVKRDRDISRKKKVNEDSDESDSESEETSKAESFDYADMDDEDEDEDELIQKDNYNDKDYEAALFEALDSEGESINEEDEEDQVAGEGDPGMDSMFADADDFSHLLERNSENTDGVHHKQIQWEEGQNKKQSRFKNTKRRLGASQNDNHKGNKKRKFNKNLNHSKHPRKKAKR